MKPKNKTHRHLGLIIVHLSIAGLLPCANAASDTWDNGGDGLTWQDNPNWTTAFPGSNTNVFTSTDDAAFSTTGAGGVIDLGGTLNIRSLVFGVSGGDAAVFNIGDANDTLNFTTAGGITINTGVTTAQNIGVAGTTLNLSTAAGSATTFTNNGSGLLTIAGNIAMVPPAGNSLLTVAGSGNTAISGTVTETGAGGSALLKTGSGTLTLSNGSTWSGTGARARVPATVFDTSLVVREGTLLLNGGTHNSSGELVIGGVVTDGGAGQNARIQIDAGTLAVANWLSVGRGNGIGGVSSDLVANNAAIITATNFSAGFNGGSASNLPKGVITLNNTSSLGIGTGGAFQLGESAGSNFTMTLNDSSGVTVSGNGSATNRYIGGLGTGTLNINGSASFNDAGTSALNVGYQTGTGIVNLNSGTFSHANGEVRVGASNTNGTFSGGSGTINISGGTATVGAITLARNNNNAGLINGTINVSGGSLTSTGDVILGYAGAGALGKLTISGTGTVNIGTTTAKWLQVGSWDTAKGQFDITGGSLNLNSSSAIKMNRQTGTGANVINQSGGSVTFYSDNATTAGGTGDLDLQYAGAAASNNTYNLNGGTLTVPRILSTATTGTRTFNFNGGTLKPTASSATFLNLGTGSASANVRNGGAIIHTNGFDVTVAQALVHSSIGGDNATDGGLTKQGNGTLTLSNANTYTGITTISSGTLKLASTGSIANSSTIINNATYDVSAVTGYTVGSSQTLGGSGTIIGNTTVAGTLAIGNSPGSMNFNNDLTLTGTATMELGGSAVAGTDYDYGNVLGTLNYGGALNIISYNSYDLSLNAAYNLFDATAITGDFTSVSVGGLSLVYSPGSDSWSGTSGPATFTFKESTGVLTVIPEPGAALLGGLGLLALLRRRRG
ncbi:MAG: autotransporter-associated beta strand repeat-containing protein [Luteolibacter sp.]|uniref:beta strand repeat-containing protein n=1 Tax=Luteolibacter sp. TaxID=1962973 RepID=UPI0032633FBB